MLDGLDGLDEVDCNIYHQGSRYEASVYAVPFLLGLLADPATPDRVQILPLLAGLAVGDGNARLAWLLAADLDTAISPEISYGDAYDRSE